MEKRYVLFDLDGTLTDSYEGIRNAFGYCLSKYGISPEPEEYRRFIGPPVLWSLKTFYGIEGEKANEALCYFREYYDSRGCLENHVYDGAEEMLRTLAAHDKKLMVATSKPEPIAIKILEHFGLADYFCFIAGSTAEDENDNHYASLRNAVPRSSKEEVIRYCLRENDIRDLEHAVMVGDRRWDIDAAKKIGMQSIGVRYGYAEPDELEQSGADIIVDTPMEIITHIV